MKKVALLVIVVMVGFGVIGCVTTGDKKTSPDVEVYFKLGNTHAKEGRYQEAIEAYKQVIKLKPDLAEAHNNLGLAYLKIKDKVNALEEYKILKTLNAEMANKLFNLINK